MRLETNNLTFVHENTFRKWAYLLLKNKTIQGVSTSHLNTLQSLHKHLLPIHRHEINTIDIHQIQDIISDLGPQCDEHSAISKSLLKRTLSGIKQFAQQVFNLAIIHRVIDFNPANYVIIPQNAPYTPRTAVSTEQQQWILALDHRAKRAAMLMMYAGLRRGEVTALQWSDIDLKEGVIFIDKSAEFVDGQPKVKLPKTQASIRTIDIPQHLIEYLEQEKGADDSPLILHGKNGEMWSKTMWQRIWRSYIKDLNIEYGYTSEAKVQLGLPPDRQVNKRTPGGIKIIIDTFTPHQLRHTFATNCYFAEIPVEVCRDWMGHADVQTTLNIYTHLDRRYKRQKQVKLDEYYFKQFLLAKSPPQLNTHISSMTDVFLEE